MIKEIILPWIEPNSEEAVLVEWLKKENEYVKKNEALLLIETTKAIFEIESEEEGILRKRLFSEGDTVKFTRTIALIGDKDDKLPDLSRINKEEKSVEDKKTYKITEPGVALSSSGKNPEEPVRERIPASPSARRVARERGVDLKNITVEKGKRITEKDVLGYLDRSVKKDSIKKVIIIGAGKGGELVVNILHYDKTKKVVGFVDDNSLLKNTNIMGVPVLGTTRDLPYLKKEGTFDELIISISTNIQFRKKVYIECIEQGFEFANAVHPAAVIDDEVTWGRGNVVLSTAHIGFRTRIGDNNFISARASIDHHSVLGSHCLISPGVCTSGVVEIGDSVILGAGVFTKNFIKIGNNVTVASGLTIFNDIPDNYVWKRKFDKNDLPKPKKIKPQVRPARP